jgi:hypothetical protein
MSIEISREIEARLADEALHRNTLPPALLKRFINERAALTQSVQPKPELPVWHLGGTGALHRRNIYDDAR